MAQRASKSRSSASATRIEELSNRDVGRAPRKPLTFHPDLLLAKVGTGKTTHHYRDKHAIFSQGDRADAVRSEEHTSELQSRRDLVCRLLLEKKKKKKNKYIKDK